MKLQERADIVNKRLDEMETNEAKRSGTESFLEKLIIIPALAGAASMSDDIGVIFGATGALYTLGVDVKNYLVHNERPNIGTVFKIATYALVGGAIELLDDPINNFVDTYIGTK